MKEYYCVNKCRPIRITSPQYAHITITSNGKNKTYVIAYFEGAEQEIIMIPMKEGDLMDVGVVEESS